LKIRMPSLSTLFFLAAVAIVIFLMSPVWADDDHYSNYRDGVTSSIDNSVSDTSRAFGIGAGDVDINECYRSWSVVLFQDSKVNKLCLARQQVAEGNFEAAAISRCSIRSVVKDYNDKAHCIRLNTAHLLAPPPAESRVDDDEDDYREDQMMLFEDLQAKVRNLEQDYEKQMQAPPQVIRRTVQQPYLSAEKKAKLREVVK